MGYLLALAASDLNPVHDVQAAASASASAIGSALLGAMKDFGSFVMRALVNAIDVMFKGLIDLIVGAMLHTTPTFANTKFNAAQPTIFNPVWRTMVVVGVTFAAIIMLIGIISAVLRGEPGLLGKQMLLGLTGVLLMASPVIPDVVQALFDIINVFSRYILLTGLSLAHHQALNTHLSTTEQVSSAIDGAALIAMAPQVPGLAVLLTLLGCVIALLVWLELIAREAIAYLAMAMVPLALAGLFFKGTSTWIKKAVDLVVAIAVSQLIIAVVLTLGFSALLATGPVASITDEALFVVFLFIATLGLPIALKLAPVALDGAIVGTEISAMARHHGANAMRKGASMAAGGMGGGAGGVGPGAGSPLVGSLARGGSGGRAGDAAATSGGSSGPKGPKGPTPGGLHDQMATAIESTPNPSHRSTHPSAGSTPPKPRPGVKPSGPHYLRPVDKNDPQKPTPKPPTRRPPGSGPEPKKENQ